MGTYIFGAILLLIVVAAVYSIYKNKKKGGGCGCGCSGGGCNGQCGH